MVLLVLFFARSCLSSSCVIAEEAWRDQDEIVCKAVAWLQRVSRERRLSVDCIITIGIQVKCGQTVRLLSTPVKRAIY